MPNARMHAARRMLVTLSALLSLAACASKSTTAVDVATAPIDRLIGEAACTSDDDCATIGIGALACGGPQAYVAWSKKQTDPQALASAVTRQRQERERQIARSGELSVCRVVPDPGARCSAAGRCELRPPAGGGGAATIR